ncbi:MAG TPA: response regulator transcription factor [Actinomycetales bacterium]|nr:response regulator transcription factor [Actinomycetales bacterium]
MSLDVDRPDDLVESGGQSSLLRVVVADDNPIVRMGLVQLLGASGRIDVVGEASTGQQALEAVEQHRPDVLLLDVRMPGGDGLDVLPEVAAQTRVLMLTQTDDDDTIVDALRRGAVGYLVYGQFDPTSLAVAVLGAARGEAALSPVAGRAVQRSLMRPVPVEPLADDPARHVPWAQLSEREVEVMTLVAAGLTNTEIATRLFLSVKTVKNHLNRIFPKLMVTTRSQAIARWVGTDEPDGTGLA